MRDGAVMEPGGRNQWQSAANRSREGTAETSQNRLRWAATGCREEYMVSRASAVGCHPLREVPSLRRRGRPILLRRALSLAAAVRGWAAAVRAWALIATAAGARLADHAEVYRCSQALV